MLPSPLTTAILLLVSEVSATLTSTIGSTANASQWHLTSWVWNPIGFTSTSTVGYVTTLTDEVTNKTCITTIFNDDFHPNGSQTIYSRTDTNQLGTVTMNIDGKDIAYPTETLQGTATTGAHAFCNGPSSCCISSTSTTLLSSPTTTTSYWYTNPDDPRGLMSTSSACIITFSKACRSWTGKGDCTYTTCTTSFSAAQGISVVSSVPYVIATPTPTLPL